MKSTAQKYITIGILFILMASIVVGPVSAATVKKTKEQVSSIRSKGQTADKKLVWTVQCGSEKSIMYKIASSIGKVWGPKKITARNRTINIYLNGPVHGRGYALFLYAGGKVWRAVLWY